MKNRKRNLTLSILGVIFLMILFSGIRKTNDSEAYNYLFLNLEKAPDIGFYVVSKIVYFIKGDIVVLYNIYYFLSIYLIYKIIQNYKVNFNFIILNLFIFTFFFHMNQIRYFLAFYLFIYSIINIYNNKKIKTLFYGVNTIIFHKSSTILFIYLIIYKTSFINYIKRLILGSLIIFLGYHIFIKLILRVSFLNHYLAYINKSEKMTLEGWVFSLVPFVLYIFLTGSIHFILSKKKGILLSSDEKYNQLIKLAIFPILFIPISKEFLDIILRYMVPFNIINLIYYVYSFKYFKKYGKFLLIFIILFLSIFNYFWIFELGLILDKKTQKYEYLEIYKNHIFLNNKLIGKNNFNIQISKRC
ncbi:MAG: EpsG family protein [Fusobacteriaceae bacterium]